MSTDNRQGLPEEEVVQTDMRFPGAVIKEGMTIEQFAQAVETLGPKTKVDPPPRGATPDQVRDHFRAKVEEKLVAPSIPVISASGGSLGLSDPEPIVSPDDIHAMLQAPVTASPQEQADHQHVQQHEQQETRAPYAGMSASPESYRGDFQSEMTTGRVVPEQVEFRQEQAPEPTQAAPVKVHNPSTPVADTSFISVDLPSQFLAYDFKDCYVGKIKGRHLSKLAQAHLERSFMMTAEVISTILKTTNPRYAKVPLAFYMTVPDYYWVLYYIRKTSYTNVTLNHSTMCNNPDHYERVQKGELDKETLIIRDMVTLTTLKETILEKLPTPQEILLPYKPHPALVADMISITEHPNYGDDGYLYLSELACYIRHDLPWDDRLNIVNDMSPDEIMAIKAYEDGFGDYGIKELATVRCKGCGASVETKISIDASSFFPSK